MSKTKGNNYKSTAHALTTSPSTILPLDENRSGLIIFNVGATDATISVGGTGDVPVKAGDHVAFLEHPPINAISAKTATGTTNLVSWVC